MDFFESQDRARRSSRLLVLYFALAVICIVLSIYLVAVLLFGFVQPGADGDLQLTSKALQWWNPEVFGIAAGGTVAAIAIACFWKISELRLGGGAVAASMGGRKILPDTRDADERRLMNVVEEMAIASGVAVPEVYVMDDEQSINGFAAGLTLQDAAIAVTSGCMKKLSRDELQGVIAHEFSHILNGDMRLNVRLIGLLFGILFLTIIGYGMMRVMFYAPRSSRSDKNGGGALAIFFLGLALYIIGGIGVFFGRLIQSAVSRQREFLADAAAVQFTRNPEGIAGALQKIGQSSSVVRHQESQDMAHFFFANGLSFSLAGIFATHPPLARRIKAILPNWDGDMQRPIAPVKRRPEPAAKPQERTDSGQAGGPFGILGRTGALDADSLQHSVAIHAAIAATLLDAIHSPAQAVAVALCLTLDSDGKIRQQQIEHLRGAVDPSLAAAVEQLSPAVAAAKDPMMLLEMVVPALREAAQPAASHGALLAEIAALSNGKDLFPWLAAIYLRSLRNSPFHTDNPQAKRYPLPAACGRLFVRLAEFEASEAAAKASILDTCTASFTAASIHPLKPDGFPKSFTDLELSLLRLRTELPATRKAILETGMTIVMHDGSVSADEHRVLQLFALIMEAPLPVSSAIN